MTHEEQIEEIMDYFDFNKVHRAMTALDWAWYDCGGVPTEAHLRKEARKLLREVSRKEPGYAIGTGGFYAKHTEWRKLKLEFHVANWEVDA